jgi:hypothetical protein
MTKRKPPPSPAAFERAPFSLLTPEELSEINIGNIIGPKVEGAAAREIKTRVVPMAGQDAVFDRASMQRKSKVRTTVIEGKHLPIIIDNE